MPVFREGGVSYLRIPAPDPLRLAAFYASVFGWKVDTDRTHPNFEDGTGDVIGHFMSDVPVAPEGGFTPYVFVRSVDATLAQALRDGASVATEPYPEGDLTVAVLRDPAGNRVGVWQRGAL